MATRDRNCSFCRKGADDVGPLVEGPGSVYICGDCVDLCRSTIDQEKWRRSPTTLADYLDRKAERFVLEAESAVYWIDTWLGARLRDHGSQPVEGELLSLVNLWLAAVLLTVVKGMLGRAKAEGLQPEERTLLEEIKAGSDRLAQIVNGRADQQATG
jgi:hypothetical protein